MFTGSSLSRARRHHENLPDHKYGEVVQPALDDAHPPEPGLQVRKPRAIEAETVLSAKLVHLLLGRFGRMLQQRSDLLKEALETSRRDDLKDARRLRARVPEGVEDTARLPHIRACNGFDLSIADAGPDGSFENVGQLVLVAMGVWIHEDPWLDGVLNDCETAARLLTAHLKVDTESAQIHKSPTIRTHVHVSVFHGRTVLPNC